MKCTCTENEVCESHRTLWEFQLVTQKLANLLEADLDSQKLFNLLPTTQLTEIGDTNEKRPNLP
jgi:hypothetical protein